MSDALKYRGNTLLEHMFEKCEVWIVMVQTVYAISDALRLLTANR
jgi:hypothetical protein